MLFRSRIYRLEPTTPALLKIVSVDRLEVRRFGAVNEVGTGSGIGSAVAEIGQLAEVGQEQPLLGLD